ncbi:DUF4401 domain-containing protein [Glaciimonas sp. PAMC28666]|uniref:DUF4401 domain-containing protein n=1 Tax=Glaciimonas sp. PAMC28666 TaxID=2807626 RepID=UPI0019667979|nr:DUF4401 domain-containing protein [Glaciimonas sp. PAMC28666]QRX83365.1 DUF4401 domain-containing protein [Glaciimonas sp. PAMC28666]
MEVTLQPTPHMQSGEESYSSSEHLPLRQGAAMRPAITQWLQEKKISPIAAERALRFSGVLPGRADWKEFLQNICLFAGVLFLAVGVIFFFSFNWDALPRFAKFILLQGLLIAAALLARRFTLDTLKGQAALLAAMLLCGALLAYFGQTYQTGADSYQLFLTWSILIFPWVLVSRLNIAWCLWLGLLNLALTLYPMNTTFGFFSNLEGGKPLSVWLFWLNGLIWGCTEIVLYRSDPKSAIADNLHRYRIFIRFAALLALASGTSHFIFLSGRLINRLGAHSVWIQLSSIVMLIVFVGFFVLYRRRRDLVLLTGCCCALIAVGTGQLIGMLFFGQNFPAMIGLMVVGLFLVIASTLAALWLRSMQRSWVTVVEMSGPESLINGSDIVSDKNTSEMSYLRLWQRLHEEGSVLSNAAPLWSPPEPPAPWFMRLMLGVCGWLAGLFLMAFFGFFLIDHLQRGDSALLIGGLGLIAVADGMLRAGHTDLWHQIALALSLAGQGMAGFWLFATYGVDVAWPLFCIALIQALLVTLIPNFLHRLLCTFFAVLALHIGCLMWLGPSPVLPICAALVALLWLDESYWQMRLRHAFLPVTIGLTLALLCLALTTIWFPSWLLTQVANNHRSDGLGNSLYRWLYLFDPAIVGMIFFALVVQLSSSLSTMQRRLTLACGLVFAILGMWVVGFVVGAMLMLLGFARGRSGITALGIVASLGYLGWFYYSMDLTLLVKSIGLMSAGGLLLTACFLQRWLPVKVENV